MIGNGLGRFAYTPLIPELIGAGWLTPPQAYYAQAANFAGYLAGALVFSALTSRMRNVVVLRVMMLLATAALFACAIPYSFWWFAIWRLASGLSGGVLIVLAPAEVLPHVPQRKVGLSAGIIFAGVAVGIAGTGAGVPLLLHFGLVGTWIALGAFSLLLTVIAWEGWPGDYHVPSSQPLGGSPTTSSLGVDRRLTGLFVEYALVAMALVPHMVFIVDFVARGLGHGVAIGSLYWIAFGLSAIGGSLTMGWLGDRVGFRMALRLVLAIQIAVVLLPAILQTPLLLLLSTILAGALVTGSSTLVIGRIRELMHDKGEMHGRAWSIATVSFALGQAVAAYGFSWLFATTNSYTLLFACGATALALALIIDIATNRLPRLSI